MTTRDHPVPISAEGGTNAREVVASFLEALGAGDLVGSSKMFAPDAVIDEAESLPFGGTWVGPQGFRDMVAQLNQSFRVKLGEPIVHSDGDSVFVEFTVSLRSRLADATAAMSGVDIYTVRGRQITRLDVFYKDTAKVFALTDAGGPQQGEIQRAT